MTRVIKRQNTYIFRIMEDLPWNVLRSVVSYEPMNIPAMVHVCKSWRSVTTGDDCIADFLVNKFGKHTGAYVAANENRRGVSIEIMKRYCLDAAPTE